MNSHSCYMDNTNKRVKVPEEKEWERVLDCLSLGLCHLFIWFTPRISTPWDPPHHSIRQSSPARTFLSPSFRLRSTFRRREIDPSPVHVLYRHEQRLVRQR